jgi:hypothetical protein
MAADSKSGAADELQQLLQARDGGPIERLTSLLRQAEQQHHGRPAAAWPRWYAAFISARQRGASVESAQVFADQYTLGQPT